MKRGAAVAIQAALQLDSSRAPTSAISRYSIIAVTLLYASASLSNRGVAPFQNSHSYPEETQGLFGVVAARVLLSGLASISQPKNWPAVVSSAGEHQNSKMLED